MNSGSSPLTRGKLNTLPQEASARRLIPAHAGKTSCVGVGKVGVPAHPRSRGENEKHDGNLPPQRRLIPAHAGKTPDSWRFRVRATAHPRSRGENALTNCKRPPAAGSSPLTRGKHPLHVGMGVCIRLIPAHAGKTGRLGSRFLGRRAHPRSRGENIRTALGEFAGDGSSPLTRGKHHG